LDLARIARIEAALDATLTAENPDFQELVMVVLGYLGGIVLTDDIDNTTAATVVRTVNEALAECLARRGSVTDAPVGVLQ
jgi:hypothetical protein